MRNRLSFLPLSCLMVFTLAGCGTSTTAPVATDDPFQQAEEHLTPLAGACTFLASSGLMTVNVAGGETAIISRRAADSAILQNGQSCDVLATASTLKKLLIIGATGSAKTVILDFTNGLFGVGTSSATSGIDVNLGVVAGNTLGIRGTASADNIAYGSGGVNLNNDGFKDITIANVDTHVVYLGDGADTFTSAGGTAIGTAFATAITVYGGAGNDLFNEGALPTVSETIYGGADIDTVSYALRPALTPVVVTIGAGVDDGGTLEVDDIKNDVEIVTGSLGNDTMTAASGVAATLNGGAGDDVLIGGTMADTLNGDAGNDTLRGKAGADILNGGDGNDIFDEETAANGGDIFNGGAGVDTLDYSARLLGVNVSMDGTAANDGDIVTPGEQDNCKADVENIKGSPVADIIVGNALANTITGGLGNDTLSGGAGDDVFLAGALNDGADAISGGTGVDTIDYSGRAVFVNVTLDNLTPSGIATEGDVLNTDMENVIGTAYDDIIVGNANANELVGGVGDDTLSGLGGDDVLEGGGLSESNILDCGTGDGDIGFGQGTGGAAARSNCEF